MDVFLSNTKKFFENLNKHKVGEYTAQCAYYTVLSFIPFIMLIVTLIQFSPIPKETLISTIKNIMPETMMGATTDIIQEVYSKSVGTISISAVFVLWSAQRGFYELSKGLHSVYDTDKEYNYIWMQIKSLILTVFFVIAIVSVLLVSVFGNSIMMYLRRKFELPQGIFNVFHISRIGMYIVLFAIFLLMYRFVPGHKQNITRQIPGAIFATVGWYTISLVFSIYLETFKGFSVMYGSLTTIVLAMMWVYFCMYIILLGAEINVFRSMKISPSQ